jgi:hypothetical protein
MKCTEENRVGVVETGTDESMSNKRGGVIVETVSDMTNRLEMIATARLS